MGPIVTLHHQLMSSADQSQTIWMVERLGYILKHENLSVLHLVDFPNNFNFMDQGHKITTVETSAPTLGFVSLLLILLNC